MDSTLQFQWLLVVSQTEEMCLVGIMNYERSSYPPALFEAKHFLRRAEKAQLMDSLKAHVNTISNEAFLETAPESEHYMS